MEEDWEISGERNEMKGKEANSSVESAKLGSEESLRYVSAKHGKLNKDPESVAEILYLLHRHARQYDAPTAAEVNPHPSELLQLRELAQPDVAEDISVSIESTTQANTLSFLQ